MVKFSDLKIASADLEIISPETARDKLRPFYEEFFENLRKIVIQKKSQESPSGEIADIEEKKSSETPESSEKPESVVAKPIIIELSSSKKR